MYQRLDGRRLSVHVLDWPAPRSERIQPKLERSMAVGQELGGTVCKERQRAGRKLRWPMKQIAIKDATPEAASALAELRDIFLEQANAKALVVLGPRGEFPGVVVRAKPDPAAIGKAY